MTSWRLAFACCAITLCSTSAQAEFCDGQQLLAGLDAVVKPHPQRSEQELVDASMAIGYVKGVCDAVEADTGRSPHKQGVAPGVLALDVRTYLRANPDALRKPAASVVVSALRGKYGK